MSLSATTVIGQPVETVWDYVMDVSNDVNWRSGLDESGWREEGQSTEVGSIGYTRANNQEMEWRIVVHVPGERVEWEFLNGPFSGRGGYIVNAVEGGTEFTLMAEIKPKGTYKLLGPIFRWVGKRGNETDVQRLKGILESATE